MYYVRPLSSLFLDHFLHIPNASTGFVYPLLSTLIFLLLAGVLKYMLKKDLNKLHVFGILPGFNKADDEFLSNH